MKSHYFFICLILLVSFNSFGQWEWQLPVPQGNNLNDLVFIKSDTSNIGFAVGDIGATIRSSNGGSSWELLDSITANRLNGLDVVNIDLGYAVGDNGTILKLVDSSWVADSSGTHYHLSAVSIASATKIIIVGYQGVVLISDGNGSWKQQYSGVNNTLYNVTYITSQIAIAVGDTGTIIRTTDNGQTWNKIATDKTDAFNDVFFINPDTGYIVGNNHLLLKTEDGGLTWEHKPYVPSEDNLYSISFINDTVGYICGANGTILTTYNGGTNWAVRSKNTSLSFNTVYPLYHAQDTAGIYNEAVICGDNGILLKKYKNIDWIWENVSNSSQNDLHKITFLNDNHGWAIGGYGYYWDKTPLIFKSSDGYHWEKYEVDTIQQFLTDICLVNSETGYMTGTNGRIYRANSSLSNWIPLKTQINIDLFSIRFAEIDTALAVGADGIILRPISGDTIWESVLTPFEEDLYKLYYKSIEQGAWAVGNHGIILRIKNNGNQITKVPTGVNVPLYDIKFPSDSVGFIVGFNGTILKLKMVGGEINKVIPIPSGFQNTLNEVYFPTPEIGYICGDRGLILKSTDGGNTWYSQYSGTNNNLRGVYFNSNSQGWIVGSGPSILFTENGGGPVIIPSLISENQTSINSFNIYPNPASHSTRIEYSLNEKGPVQISAFDLSGRQIKVFKKDVQGKGLHTEKLNIAGLTKGIYLLIIQTGNEHKAEKLVVFD
ncbi:MAG: T9SS type A sorting domain-containing protein [Bacteroidales bacterium]|nr:T9SS type A sorting domain-containing protein [Bacteroidales bacterium]